MSKVHGKDVTLSLLIDGSPSYFSVIGCSRTCSLTTDVETAGISTVGSGTFREYKGLNKGWSVTIEGLCTIDENMGLLQLRQLQFTLQPVYIDFSETAGGTTIHYSGYIILQSIQASGAYNDIENYNISGLGTGELHMQSGTLIYGNYPEGFEIIEVLPDYPTAGFTRLSFLHDYATPTPDNYTLEITDLTEGGIVTYVTSSGNVATIAAIVYSDLNYSFRIRSNYFSGAAHSEYSPVIYWPVPFSNDHIYICDSDGLVIIDSDNQVIED